MAVSITRLENAAPADPPRGAEGVVETRAFFDHERHPIHMHLHRLAPLASFRIEAALNDSCLYVWEGEVSAGGSVLDPRSSLIVEFGAALEVRAGATGAVLLVFALRDRSADARAGGHVHLMPNGIVPRVHSMGGSGAIGGSLHFVADCPTCELWLHENDFHEGDNETMVHSHSEDEVIFVSEGSIRLGDRHYPRGTAILVPAFTKYGFHSGPDGMKTVCFRGVAPTLVEEDGHIIDETEMWTTAVGMPHALQYDGA